MSEYKQHLQEYWSGKFKRNQVFDLGATPLLLQEHGLQDRKLIMTQAVMKKVMGSESDGGHEITKNVMKDLLRIIDNPQMIIKGNENEKNSLLVVSDREDRNCRPILIAIHGDRKFKGETFNIIKSVYGRENFDDFILAQREKNNILYEAIKKEVDNASLRQPGRLERSSAGIKSVPRRSEILTERIINFNNSLPQKSVAVNDQNLKIEKSGEAVKPKPPPPPGDGLSVSDVTVLKKQIRERQTSSSRKTNKKRNRSNER